jgi:dUTP pyrophosphatase
MKLKIKVKKLDSQIKLPKVIQKGDWIDLMASKETPIEAPHAGTLKGKQSKTRDVISEVTYIPLGVAVKLPKGFEAIMAARSSTPKNIGVMQANGIGVIDSTYCGDDDQWMFPVVPLRKTLIMPNTRICQFRIQLSQKANIVQKLKWLLCSGIKIVEVDKLDSVNRNGLGKGTGV